MANKKTQADLNVVGAIKHNGVEIDYFGSSVIANPTLVGTETYLESISINSVSYKVPNEDTSNKVNSISNSSTDTQYPSAKCVYDALALKQNTLTFDDEPTDGSNNPVKSNGIYDALQDVREIAKGKATSMVLETTTTIAIVKAITGLSSFQVLNGSTGKWEDKKTELLNGDYDSYSSQNSSFDSNNDSITLSTGTNYVVIFGVNNGAGSSFKMCQTYQCDYVLGVGGTVYITKLDVPDRWLSSGRTFNKLETSKVDLSTYYTKTQTDDLLATKQATLVSGTNIKTINSTSLLGSGDIAIPVASLTTTTGSEAVSVDSSSLNVMTRDTAQSISGAKTFTNNVVLQNTGSGDSPYLEFLRGTESDNYNDWRIIDSGGYLYFKQKGQTDSDFTNIISITNQGTVSITGTTPRLNIADANHFIRKNASSNLLELGSNNTLVMQLGSGTSTLASHFRPTSNNSKDLGHQSYQWKDFYLGGSIKTGTSGSVVLTLPSSTGTLALTSDLSSKQDTLVSGTNIKSVNSTTLLGSGNISIPVVSANPTVPSGTTPTSLSGLKIDDTYYSISGGGSVNVVQDLTSNTAGTLNSTGWGNLKSEHSATISSPTMTGLDSSYEFVSIKLSINSNNEIVKLTKNTTNKYSGLFFIEESTNLYEIAVYYNGSSLILRCANVY